MPDPPRRSAWHAASPLLLVAAALLAALWFLAAEHRIATRWGFPLDDSWIYATFARNVATGQGYSFNPGEHVAGATGPLYVFVLALLYQIFWDVVLPAKVVGILCLCATAVLTHRTMRRLAPESEAAPLVAGLSIALSPALVWAALSGMEIPLYVLLVTAGLWFYVRGQGIPAALCWAVGVWVRPDGLLLALLGVLLPPRRTLGGSARSLLAAGPVLLAFFAFNLATGGSLLPNSVVVKSHFGYQLGARALGMLREWASLWGLPLPKGEFPPHALLLLPAMVFGAVITLRPKPAIAAYAFGLPAAFAVFGASSGAHARYLMPTIPFGILLAVLGLMEAVRRWVPSRRRAGVFAAVGVACLLWQGAGLERMRTTLGWNVENINDMQRLLAEAIHRSTLNGDTIAVNDVGAMGYFSGCYIVDLVGLVSPPLTFDENLHRYRPKYLAIFPNWYRSYMKADWSVRRTFITSTDSTIRYAPVWGAGLSHNTICARDQMIVFQRLGPGELGPEKLRMSWH